MTSLAESGWKPGESIAAKFAGFPGYPMAVDDEGPLNIRDLNRNDVVYNFNLM
jgi:hypothetical protein